MLTYIRHCWKVMTGKKLIKVWGQSGLGGAIGVLTYSDGSEIVMDYYPPTWTEESLAKNKL